MRAISLHSGWKLERIADTEWCDVVIGGIDISGYRYTNGGLNDSHDYLLPAVLKSLDELGLPDDRKRVFEIGCGNGSVANELSKHGWEVLGVDPSEEGIAQGRKSFPALQLKIGSAYDDLAGEYGQYPVVLSLEVIEHVYAPRRCAQTMFDLLEKDGTAIISTPYHGYFKNLALAATGMMDAHFTALWEHGHIKFWSMKTLRQLLHEAGFADIRFERVGRIPPLAKSMIAIARKP